MVEESIKEIFKFFNKEGTKMKKTLVIHPSDRSTDFLSNIYKDKKDWTILTSYVGTKNDLIKYMESFDRIIMMGHGSPSGLFNVNDFYSVTTLRGGCYVIDDNFVDVLSRKETISIWCHSDKFFSKHNIKGFHTGMVISEVSEADFVLGHTPLNTEETLDNMNFYANLLGECIERSPNEIREYMLEHYNREDEVSEFNRNTLTVL